LNVSTIGGYVNFFVDKKLLLEDFINLSIEPKEKKNETIIVDYVGANAGKPLHIGHLCTPSTGQAFINMFRHLGYDVIGDTHFGDWGGIFGKLIFAWKNKDTNPLEKLNDLGVKYLLELYQWFHTESELHLEIDEKARVEFKKLSE